MAIVSRVALGEKEVQVTHPTEKVPKPRQPVGSHTHSALLPKLIY